MPASTNILERLRWKIGLGLVIAAAGFATQAAHSAGPSHEVARSSWGKMAAPAQPVEANPSPAVSAAESTDVARSSWGKAAAAASDSSDDA